jgi:DNA polymerase-4
VLDFLHPLPIGALWGVGPATGEALARRGLTTVRDLAETPPAVLAGWLGPAAGARLTDLALGRDPRQVVPTRREKSIGHENTFAVDVRDEEHLKRELLEQADRVAVRLRDAGLRGRTVSLKLRYTDFTTVSRARTLAEPTDLAKRIHEETVTLLTAERLRGRAVRLLGTRVEQLVAADADAGRLWSDDDQWRRAEGAVDVAAARFGRGAVRPAALLRRDGRDRERLVDGEG